MRYTHLLSPGKIGNLEVKNRAMMAPMSVSLGNPDGTISDDQIAYYMERVRGGIGFVFTEYSYVQPSGRSSEGQISVCSDDVIPGLKRLADAVHGGGAKIGLQLQHGGRRSIIELRAPSPIPMVRNAETPHELTTAEVYELIDDFIAGAVRAKTAGFDLVEIHCAHGYLLNDFVSPHANRRTDEFGGSTKARASVVVKIIRGIKEKCGKDFPISIRMSAEEWVTDGHKKQDSAEMAQIFDDAGADLISVSCGVCGVGRGIAPAAREAGYNVEAAEEIAKVVNCAVCVAGRINEPEFAEEILRKGLIQFVAIGRALFADSEFINKAAEGREDEICPCVGCLQRCYGNLYHGDGRKRSCMISPFAMRETRMIITPTDTPKNISIVGAGPAGLEFAWIAAKRGHSVTLYDKNVMPGGQFRIAAVPPHKQLLTRAIRYYDKMAEIYGVDRRYGTEVTPEMIISENPDVVVLATGAQPVIPRIPGIEEAEFLTAQQVLMGAQLKGRSSLVIGGGAQGAETADHMAQYGYDVSIIEMRDGIAMDDPEATRELLFERFKENDVKFYTSTKVTHIYSDGVDAERNGEPITLRGFDNVVIAVGVRSFNPMEEQLTGKVKKLLVIGDAVKAKDAVEAIWQGAVNGLAI